MSFDMTFL